MKLRFKITIPLTIIVSFLVICLTPEFSIKAYASEGIPAYSGSPYITINNNVPSFTSTDLSRLDAFEIYSNLDNLGRCGVAYANICKEIMPTSERGAIGNVRPSGWHTVKYNDLIDGNYLYNRCHLIGYQLAGENANTKNLITGTRYLNVTGMIPFENAVANYVEKTNNHVLYRVTPIFEGNNLVASYVQIEAWSVEDSGSGICYNVLCYNVQPGITINYATGDSSANGEIVTSPSTKTNTTTAQTTPQTQTTAVTNQTGSNSTVYLPASGSSYHNINNCGRMNPSKATTTTESSAIAQGYSKCSKCW